MPRKKKATAKIVGDLGYVRVDNEEQYQGVTSKNKYDHVFKTDSEKVTMFRIFVTIGIIIIAIELIAIMLYGG